MTAVQLISGIRSPYQGRCDLYINQQDSQMSAVHTLECLRNLQQPEYHCCIFVLLMR